ncbi:hypothetical protein K438DRAFT_1859415 [Mycena galopus ATCC 62051]|nr:hypothetical protein K438DRAFT_1859415 [Mycena galopus ATCC 62051]
MVVSSPRPRSKRVRFEEHAVDLDSKRRSSPHHNYLHSYKASIAATDAKSSIARPVSRHDKLLPKVSPDLPRRVSTSCKSLVTAPAIPTNPDESSPASPSHLKHSRAPPALSFRPDALSDRAATAVEKCYHKAFSMRQRFSPCQPLLLVAESSECCFALMGIFNALALDNLLMPPPVVRHDCAPLGHCPYESWHVKHAEKMKDLARHLDQFLVDFTRPCETTVLRTKLGWYVDNFRRFPARIKRSWIRLQFDINETKMENQFHIIQNWFQARRGTERDLVPLLDDYDELFRRRSVLLEQFNATPWHIESSFVMYLTP